jgi:hypothetical protein
MELTIGKWNREVKFNVDVPVKSLTQDGYPYIIKKTYSAEKRKWWQRRKMWGNREVVAIYTVTFPESF